MRKRIFLAALIAGLTGVGMAWADDDCQVPMDRWKTRTAVEDTAETQGWQLDRIKIDDGCYEVRGVDADGRRFKAKLDPATLKVIKWKGEDRDDDHRDRRRDRVGATEVTTPASPPAGGILGGSAPPSAVMR